MSRTVLIHGDGFAASCCAFLLARKNFAIGLENVCRSEVPALMVGAATQALLEDIFERPGLFAGLPRIQQRVVLWGGHAEPVTVPHSAIVVSERTLLDRIESGRDSHHARFVAPDWTIHAARPLPDGVREYAFGQRMADASLVRFQGNAEANTCWIESLDGGWLFLLPNGGDEGWLLSVGGSAHALLSASRLVASRISEVVESRGTFPCHPRIVDPFCGDRWLSCGAAALRFDPLCGDGVGQAVRQAILASAVTGAVAAGGDADGVMLHYQTRVVAAFSKHLGICRHYYQTGGAGEWWEQQLQQIDDGLRWCAGRFAASAKTRYRLRGFDLEPVG
jgi:hypothetical protein